MAKGRPKNTPEMFWLKVDRRGPSDCWPWLRAVRNGYGSHCVNKKTHYAHRYAYEITFGAPPAGVVMHLCNNKLCCNPLHLAIGDAKTNTSDAYRDGLAKAGARHHKAKFSAKTVAAIRSSSLPQTTLSKIYGVSQQHISRIKSGHSRAHEEINA